jgi:hypothetical protein
LHEEGEVAEIFGDRFWVYTAEAGIVRTSESMDIREEPGKDALTCAVHSVKAYFVGELGEGFEVKARADVVLVEGFHVVDFYLAGGEEGFPVGGGWWGGVGDEGFYFAKEGDGGGAAIRGFELVAKVNGRIMRSREDNA